MGTEIKIPAKVIRHELFVMKLRGSRLCRLVDQILHQEFGRRVFSMSANDELRLLTLDVWRQRYKVTLRYILRSLIPYFDRRNKPFRSTGRGLGCTVPNLVGRVAEKHLRDCIAQDYPDNENVELWRWRERQRIIRLREGKPEPQRPLNLLDCASPEEYVRRYSRRVEQRRKELLAYNLDESNTRRHYRNNPWL